MEFIKKYLVYVLCFFIALLLAWGVYNHLAVASLEKKNGSLLASNEKLNNNFKLKQSEWEGKFYNLEVKAKRLEGEIKTLNSSYLVLIKKNTELEKKLASIKIPVEKTEKVAKFQELGYDAEIIVSGAPAAHGGSLFDWESSDKLLKVAMEVEVIKEMNASLKESVVILEKKVGVQDEIIKNTEAEVRMTLDLLEYTQTVVKEKEKIISDLGKENQKLILKAKRTTLFGAIGIVIGVLASIFIIGI